MTQFRGPQRPVPSLQDADSNALLREMLQALQRLPEGLRQTQTDHLWASINNYVREYAFAIAQPANTPLQAGVAGAGTQAQTSGLELIESVFVSVPAGATGVLALGEVQFYVGAGTTVLSPMKEILAATDARTLTVSSAGPAAIWLTGIQLPTRGVL